MTSREFQDRLARRVRRAGLFLPDDLTARLEAYYRLLTIWNRKINLTALSLDEPTPDSLDRLLVEPLLAARHVQAGAQRMIDIGSGGGSPAIPLALASRLALLMVESKTRKSVFLREALRVVELSNGEVVTSRFEGLLARPDLHEAHDLLTIRAVRVQPRILMTLQAFVRPGGELFLFRSSGESENVGAPFPFSRMRTIPLLESLGSQLLVLEKRQGPPASVPRETLA